MPKKRKSPAIVFRRADNLSLGPQNHLPTIFVFLSISRLSAIGILHNISTNFPTNFRTTYHFLPVIFQRNHISGNNRPIPWGKNLQTSASMKRLQKDRNSVTYPKERVTKSLEEKIYTTTQRAKALKAASKFEPKPELYPTSINSQYIPSIAY